MNDMSDGSLSQDEIDALLQGSGDMDFDDAPAQGASLSDQEKNAFGQIINGVVDSQASNFSMLISKNVEMQNPSIDLIAADELRQSLADQTVRIAVNYSEGVTGEHLYLLNPDTAISIASMMMGQEGVELDEAAVSALQEALSQLNGPVTTAIGDSVGNTVMTATPEGSVDDSASTELPDGEFVLLRYPMTIEGEEPQELLEIFALPLVKEILNQSGMSAAQPAPQAQQPQQAQPQAQQNPFGGEQQQAQGGMMSGGMNMGGGMMGQQMGQQMGPNVQSVQFPNLSGGVEPSEQGNISLLMDVYMEMTVELGRTKKLIKEILGMGEGTIIELDKLAGEPVDILVNHKLIAKGEVVVIDENFGVRVTEIVSTMERINNMT
jgi:flagellar motor switch protein FliN/FliY